MCAVALSCVKKSKFYLNLSFFGELYGYQFFKIVCVVTFIGRHCPDNSCRWICTKNSKLIFIKNKLKELSEFRVPQSLLLRMLTHRLNSASFLTKKWHFDYNSLVVYCSAINLKKLVLAEVTPTPMHIRRLCQLTRSVATARTIFCILRCLYN